MDARLRNTVCPALVWVAVLHSRKSFLAGCEESTRRRGTITGEAQIKLDVVGLAPTSKLPDGRYYTFEPVSETTLGNQVIELDEPVTGLVVRDKYQHQ